MVAGLLEPTVSGSTNRHGLAESRPFRSLRFEALMERRSSIASVQRAFRPIAVVRTSIHQRYLVKTCESPWLDQQKLLNVHRDEQPQICDAFPADIKSPAFGGTGMNSRFSNRSGHKMGKLVPIRPSGFPGRGRNHANGSRCTTFGGGVPPHDRLF